MTKKRKAAKAKAKGKKKGAATGKRRTSTKA